MIELRNTPDVPKVKEAVLFPFDRQSIPFGSGLRLDMISGKGYGRKGSIVLKRSTISAPDDDYVRFYGTVIPFEDELRMWYPARGKLDARSDVYRLCFATSTDGRNWQKPELGLIEYDGHAANNIVDLFDGEPGIVCGPIIHDPDDLDPSRRFKGAFWTRRYRGKVAVACSADGLRWTEPAPNPCGQYIEPSGLIRCNGCYYLNGHGGVHYGPVRNLVTYASYDFEHWTAASCLGYQRDRAPDAPHQHASGTAGEQVHLGAGLWDRGNVILGVTDLWHGHPSGDLRLVTMDLGLVISHDALHYQEPAPDFRLVPGYQEVGYKMDFIDEKDDIRRLTRGPAVTHGQGMCNWHDETLLFYEAWNDGDVRLVTWPRDRLGCMRWYDAEGWLGTQATSEIPRHCITCPIKSDNAAGRVFVNADGLGEHSELTVQVLDEQFRPAPGYSGDACVAIKEPGLRQPVSFSDKGDTINIAEPFRLQVTWGGVRPEDARLFAVYVA
ncbi:MAG: hypothetical protein QF785_12000 [Phycisphaeraceae bacterium]|nr:hypothetical protein [Phycisphaeraceae bacterium]